MSKKTKNSSKLWLILLSVVAFLALAIILIPPQITLNNLKPKIENVILTQTGIPAKIHGDINFSLLGKASIVAHNVTIPNGAVSSVEFNIPFFDIFNLTNANITGDIYVKGASLDIEKIDPFETNNKIVVDNSKIKFLNKEYKIIHADITNKNLDAFVRTDQHKYEIKSIDNNFIIKNKNNDLNLTGELLKNGTARGHISIIAQNVNRWFEFQEPKIYGHFPITADFIWDGNYGIKFYNISADGVTGNIELKDDGYKIINLKSDTADYDMSFFIQNPELLQNATFNLDFYGDLRFLEKKFKHLKMITMGSEKKINIDTIIMGDMQVHGGTIDANGAHNLNISLPENGVNTTCLFNGTPTNWSCDNFSYGNSVTGKMHVTKNNFDADIYSSIKFENIKSVVLAMKRLGNNGKVKFDFPDMAGTLNINKNNFLVEYNRLDNKSLNWANIDLKFLPDFMRNENGNFVWTNGSMIFVPNSEKWQLSMHQDFFVLHGNSFKEFIPNSDLQSLSDWPYVVSGNYKNGNISNLTIEIANHKFVGILSGKSITLKTDVLNIDSFASQYFMNNFEELSFFTNHPILLPFDTNMNIALSTNKLIYKNQEYKNFVYSLHKDTQTFSITDSNRGNILATINKNNIKYDINIQLNKFLFKEKVLSENMPLNISDTFVTAEIKLNTYGKIAHDIINNLNGTFDASFDGGKLYGLGLSEFYASAPQLTTLNAEYVLSDALTNGVSPIKKMHIVGTYENGDIKTTKTISLTLPHTNVSGMFEINKNEMNAKLELVLRGTSAGPEPINLIVHPDGSRDFSLSQIMMNFDPEYMREFVKSHNQF